MKTATKLTYASPDDPFIKNMMIKSIERLTGRRKLEKMYSNLLGRPEEESNFWEAALSELQLKLHTIRVTIGDPIPFEQLAGIKGRQNLTNHLRQITYELKYKV